jgi:hypothetical protein
MKIKREYKRNVMHRYEITEMNSLKKRKRGVTYMEIKLNSRRRKKQ